eukprot:776119-Amphidinium_carterae.1
MPQHWQLIARWALRTVNWVAVFEEAEQSRLEASIPLLQVLCAACALKDFLVDVLAHIRTEVIAGPSSRLVLSGRRPRGMRRAVDKLGINTPEIVAKVSAVLREQAFPCGTSLPCRLCSKQSGPSPKKDATTSI